MPAVPCCSQPSCTACTGVTPPTTIQITISGATACVGCTATSSNTFQNFIDTSNVTGTINGTYCATYVGTWGNGCHYQATLPTPITVSLYTSGTSCASAFTTITISTIDIYIMAFGNYIPIMGSSYPTFKFAILARGSVTNLYPGGSTIIADAFRYYDSTFTCANGSFSSQIAACGPAFRFDGSPYPITWYTNIFTGGTATLVIDGC